MNLREAKRLKRGDKIQHKKTGEIFTIKDLTFGQAGIGYASNCIIISVNENNERYVHSIVREIGRYTAMFGPNTKQFWLYDNKKDTYIDPPIEILDELNNIRWKGSKETSENICAAETRLEEIANTNPSWLHDGHEYNAEHCEI